MIELLQFFFVIYWAAHFDGAGAGPHTGFGPLHEINLQHVFYAT